MTDRQTDRQTARVDRCKHDMKGWRGGQSADSPPVCQSVSLLVASENVAEGSVAVAQRGVDSASQFPPIGVSAQQGKLRVKGRESVVPMGIQV